MGTLNPERREVDPIQRAWNRATPESREIMANADFDQAMSLAAAMGLIHCIHGCWFPCAQCLENRHWNEAATGKKLTEAEFEAIYALPE